MNRLTRHLTGVALLGISLVLTSASTASAAEDSATGTPPKRPAVGDAAPVFALPSTTGATVDLASLQGKERAIVVFFRGSW